MKNSGKERHKSKLMTHSLEKLDDGCESFWAKSPVNKNQWIKY